MLHIPMNKKGVSNIIGTLLTLVMVVVLFSSMFLFVMSLEGPPDSTLADFQATYEESGTTRYVNITHTGGEKLFDWRTDIFVFVDNQVVNGSLNLSSGGITEDFWDIGQTWRYNVTNVSANSQISVMITDKVADETIWRGEYGGLAGSVIPIIYRIEAEPYPVARGDDITISIWVYDKDDDMKEIKAYLLPIGGGDPENITSATNGNRWDIQTTVDINTPLGADDTALITLSFTAYDNNLNNYTKTKTIKVIHERTQRPKIEFAQAFPDPVWEDDYFDVTARITDDQDDLNISALWVYNSTLGVNETMNGSEIGNVYITNNSIQAPTLNPGELSRDIQLIVYAQDTSGHYNETTVSLTVIDSETPIIAWATVEPNTFFPGTTVMVRAKVIDQEDDVNTVTANLTNVGLGYHTLPHVGSDIYEVLVDTTGAPEDVEDNIVINAVDDDSHNATQTEVFLRVLNTTGTQNKPPIITLIDINPETTIVDKTFDISVTVIDVDDNLDENSVKVNLSALGTGLGNISLTDTGDGRVFNTTGLVAPSIPSGQYGYRVTAWASDDEGNTSYQHRSFDVVEESGILEDPDISILDMEFDDEAPVHSSGKPVLIRARVANIGGTGNSSSVKVVVEFVDEGPEGTIIIGNDSIENLITEDWVDLLWWPNTGGEHKITVRLLNSTPVEDAAASSSNNEDSKNITVRPAILLVDDDHAPADGGMWDTTSWMRSALKASDFADATHITTVTGLDGPKWDSGFFPLQNYDIVIWMTGYENTNLLTASDKAALETFLSHNRSLWLISEGAMDDPTILNWQMNGTSVLHIDPTGVVSNTAPVDPVSGYASHPVTAGKVYNTTTPANPRGPYFQGDYIVPDADGKVMLKDDTGDTIAVSYNESYKSVFFSWEFSKMLYPADQATLSYRVIRWLSGLEEWTGEDIAVAQMFTTPDSPDYNENLTITAKLRNNGENAQTVDAAFYIDGVRVFLTDPKVFPALSADTISLNPGEEGDVYITMVANLAPGLHTIDVVADPENDILETNELNNRLSGDDPIFDLNLYVRFTLLVVDDDGSPNNLGVNTNVTNNMTEALDFIGYNYTTHVVNTTDSGPTPADIARYKGTIWLCGESDSNTLTATDQDTLRDYIMNENGQLWLIGQDILSELAPGDTTFVSGDFAYDILHIASVEHDQGTSNPIRGVDYNEIAHGMAYQTDTTIFTDEGDRITPTADAEGIFWQDSSRTSFNAVQWESSVTGSKTVFMPWEYAFLVGLDQRPLEISSRSTSTRATQYLFENFAAGTGTFSYQDDILQTELGYGTPQPAYADGSRVTNEGYSGTTSLYTQVGGVDGTAINDMSGGWETSFTVTGSSTIYVSFWYRHWADQEYDAGEESVVYASIDDTLWGPPNSAWSHYSYIDHPGTRGGNPYFEWRKASFVATGISGGAHVLELGLYNGAKNDISEWTQLWIDDVYIGDGNGFTTVWTDGFESNNFGNWDSVDSDWTIRDDGENDWNGQSVGSIPEGNRAANAQDSDGSTRRLQKNLPDISGYEQRELRFWWDVQDIDNDGARPYVQCWHDGGWDGAEYYLREWGYDNRDYQTSTLNDWHYEVIDLETYWSITDWTNQRIRFVAPSGMGNNDDFMLDDVRLTGILPPGNTPVTTEVTLTPIPSNEATIAAIQATITSQGGEQADRAEWWFGDLGADPGEGSGTQILLPDDGAWDEVVEVARDPNVDISGLADGSYDYSMRGRSVSGWGIPVTGSITITSDMPATIDVAVTPNPVEYGLVTLFANITDLFSNLDEAEWFYDGSDAGAGNNNPMTAVDGAFDEASETVTATIDTTALGVGGHRIFVRGKDVGDRWNTTIADGTSSAGTYVDLVKASDEPATLDVDVTPNPAVEITAVTLFANVSDLYSSIDEAEWFYDGSDAGFGNNNGMTAVDGAFDEISETITATIDVSSLSAGVHRILVRGKDSGNEWNTNIVDGSSDPGTYVDLTKISNPPVTSNVQVSPDPTNGAVSVTVTANVTDAESLISEAEAYVDNDPGLGNGIPLTLIGQGPTPPVSISVSGNVGIGFLPEGPHTMYVRARQVFDGAWGSPASVAFQVTVPDTTPPEVLNPSGSPNPTEGSKNVTITATLKDDKSIITGAEYQLDSTAGVGGTWTSMNVVDGSWDETLEQVEATFNVSGLTYGEHWVYIRGYNSFVGDWGAHSSFRLMVTRPPVEEKLGVQSELAFMVLKFFDHPETRPELRVVNVDFNITSQVLNKEVKPQLGETYLVSAEVYNHGGTNTNAVVKLLDGENIISIQSTFVPAHGKVTVQGVWVPQIVGERNIIAQITQDPNEIFTLNNQAYRTLDTYYFYDDMESGTDKWTHDDTIVLINGESKLDFLNPPVNSTIVGDFVDVVGFNWTSESYHSEDQSVFVRERNDTIPPEPADALVSIVIDSSTSMSGRSNGTGVTWLDVAKESAKVLVDGLSDVSAVSVFSFSGSNPLRIIATTPLAGAGRAQVEAAIDSITTVGGMTPIWDATGEAYVEVRDQMPSYPLLAPNVVVLSDGADYQSNDGSTLQDQKLEAASNEWAPWHDMDRAGGYPTVTYADHKGKYTIPYTNPYPGEWWTQGGGSFVGTRKGLLTSDIPIYTIGLALEHYDPPNEPTMAVWPGEGVTTNDAVYTGDVESGTTEYNLWRIANTSGAEYYYSPDPDDLGDIFLQILQDISISAVTRAPAEVATRAITEKHVITNTFSLEETASAKLSFYHKYDLAFGYNGGIVMVGINVSGSWIYQYVTPSQLYPSNLWTGASETDDLGRQILWAYNGISASGTFNWEYAEVDLTSFLGEDEVRVKFQYLEYAGGGGGGWWLDDMQVKVSRSDNVTADGNVWDQWELTNEDSTSGLYSWVNKNDTQGFKGSLDNSLYTQPIDLTNALIATLSFNTKFNFNETPGRPPDGLRVEISADNGVTWRTLTLGVRSAWGLSGSGDDTDDNVTDGKAYTGLDPDGDGWVAANTLTRISTDLSGWVGSTVMLRFRVVTASDDNTYFGSTHYEEPLASNWAGLWIDDVIVQGQSVTG